MNKFLLLAIAVCQPFFLLAQWSGSTTQPLIVAKDSANFQDFISLKTIAADKGSVIVLFANGDGTLFAQKISAAGKLLWGAVDTPLQFSEESLDFELTILDAIHDGSGGVIICWELDEPMGAAYIQKINAAGVLQWGNTGKQIIENTTFDFDLSLAGDNAGGVYIGWTKTDPLTNYKAAIQHFNASGNPMWATGGISAFQTSSFELTYGLVEDGAGGVIMIAGDSRNDPHGTDFDYFEGADTINIDVYAQKINASGVLQWGNGGKPVIIAKAIQYASSNSILPDGNGGVVVFCTDSRDEIIIDSSHYNQDIYAQLINSNGIAQWGDSGKPIATANTDEGMYQYGVYNKNVHKLGADKFAGIYSIYDTTTNSVHLIAQAINTSGNLLWNTGRTINNTGNGSIASNADEKGNLVTFFVDDNTSSTVEKDGNAVFGKKLSNANGSSLWFGTSVGTPIFDNESIFNQYITSVPTIDSGSICIWSMRSFSSNPNLPPEPGTIVATRVNANGSIFSNQSNTGYISIKNGNWNDPTIWKNGKVPDANTEVIVTHTITVTANAVCKTLYINNNTGAVRVNAGITLNIKNQ